ncbi:Alpha/Beta hydrolase protein [Aspergillus egyptiacus]|nr:Alpha/Beta hydrolase protein [Aspergillus egyptiacus]
MYGKFASDHGLKADSIALPDGTQAHWLGDPSAEKMLLYLHGGGYLLPAVEGHFHLLHQTVRKVEQQGGKLAVLFLSYDLSIIAPYPRQLQQATALLRHTLTVLGRRPEDILLAGDSAGGNLLLALVSHTVHQHPQVDPLDLPGKLAGVALLSPWVTFDSSADAMRRNLHRDILALPVLKKWAAIFQGGAASDFYLEPLSAPSDWWQGFPAKEVLIMAGGDELFVDDIAKFSKQFDAANSQTVTKIVRGEAHDHPVMEFVVKEPQSEQRRIFEAWILENCLKK